MFVIKQKIISTNLIWGGRKWLTKDAKAFKRFMIASIRAKRLKLHYDEQEPLAIHFRFGISRDLDASNGIKLCEDAICEALGIDDIIFQGVTATKEKVKKGEEFIAFNITAYDESAFLPSPTEKENSE